MISTEIPKITNDKGHKSIKIKFKEFNCLGAKPPHDHPHIFLNFGRKKKLYAPISELYINTLVKMVRPPGVEPGRHYLPRDFKSLVSTCSTMAA